MTYDEVYDILNKLADELPQEFFKDLNGGINLSEETKMQPASIAPNLYIMGQYSTDPFLGRRITIFYGSFEHAYGHCSREVYENELRKTLRHEFRHHLEGLGRLRDLEVQDEIELAKYHHDNEERLAREKEQQEARRKELEERQRLLDEEAERQRREAEEAAVQEAEAEMPQIKEDEKSLEEIREAIEKQESSRALAEDCAAVSEV